MVAAVPGYPGINRRITRVATTGCWRVKTHRPDGYAQFGRLGLVHRIAYVAFTGKAIPPGYHVHHACGTRNCVNPDHLVLMSASDHSRLHNGPARIERPAGECLHGHPWADYGHVNTQGRWICLVCRREAGHRYDVKRRAPISVERS